MTSWHKIVTAQEESGEPCVLITVLGTQGSTPRESGTKMVVTTAGNHGTIGGGHLEFTAIQSALNLLSAAPGQALQKIEYVPLGPSRGQCCGGSTTLLFESFPVTRANIMLFGAGHVGTSLAAILAQLPCKLHWVDSRAEEFPASVPDNISKVLSDAPADEVALMAPGGYYIVMTHNHPLDFAITEAILKRGDARYIGLIGSETKWRRFKMRFDHRQYPPEFYAPVRCPVGLQDVPGKLPVEVAVSVAGEIIADMHQDRADRSTREGVSWRDLKTLANASDTDRAAPARSSAGEDSHA